jgi:exopolysaccharide biosynthesis polyprenyl glycosylphosphotransferase
MNRQKNGKKRWRFLPLRFTLYALIYATFFGIMGLNNWQMWTLSRTSGVTILTFTVLLTVMLSVYGGYDIGKRKSKPVISSLVLAVGLTDLITYFQLEIMNVNDAKYTGLTLFGWDFALLLCAMATQILVIILMTRLGNSLYFSVHPPEKCCIIANSREAAEHVAIKLGRYKLQYAVCDMVNFNAKDVKKCILRSDAVFFADVPAEHRVRLLEFCYEQHKNVYTTADLYDVMVANGRQVILDDCPFVVMGRGGLEPYEQLVKRIMDIVISSIAILVFSPVMLLAAIAIMLEDGRPAFFLQKRKTIDGNVFEIVKFRTMRKEAAEDGRQVSVHLGDGRITRVGAILRKFRLDELTQFFNILKGDMSMVGPRPEMLENVAQYSKEFPAFVYRQKMKAGLTGYAQIEGRYNTTAKDKLMMDLMYIENYSIWMDVKLIFRTLTVFFKADSTQGFEIRIVESDAHAKAAGDIKRTEAAAESTEFASTDSISSTYHSAG